VGTQDVYIVPSAVWSTFVNAGLDCGLYYRLDCGLDYGLDYGLDWTRSDWDGADQTATYRQQTL